MIEKQRLEEKLRKEAEALAERTRREAEEAEKRRLAGRKYLID